MFAIRFAHLFALLSPEPFLPLTLAPSHYGFARRECSNRAQRKQQPVQTRLRTDGGPFEEHLCCTVAQIPVSLFNQRHLEMMIILIIINVCCIGCMSRSSSLKVFKKKGVNVSLGGV